MEISTEIITGTVSFTNKRKNKTKRFLTENLFVFMFSSRRYFKHDLGKNNHQQPLKYIYGKVWGGGKRGKGVQFVHMQRKQTRTF